MAHVARVNYFDMKCCVHTCCSDTYIHLRGEVGDVQGVDIHLLGGLVHLALDVTRSYTRTHTPTRSDTAYAVVVVGFRHARVISRRTVEHELGEVRRQLDGVVRGHHIRGQNNTICMVRTPTTTAGVRRKRATRITHTAQHHLATQFVVCVPDPMVAVFEVVGISW